MSDSVSRARLPLLVLLFAATGCAALIYEIVWFQLLQLVIGSSAVSLGILLGAFMGGMCLGSLALPRFVSSAAHPLRVYAVIELGIAACGLAILFGMPLADRLYTALGGGGAFGVAVRAILCALCLLPPTLLMGASLPAVSRWIRSSPDGVSWLGFFYGGNIAGAVVGCLAAGFWLLRLYDTTVATFAAAAINVAAALISLALARRTPYQPPIAEPLPPSSADVPRPLLIAIALSGLSALACEVIWTRQLSLILGGTVYTFSIILAVFLFGLGIGSTAASFLARHIARPRLAFAACQALLALAIAWTASMLARSIPFWPINPSLTTNPWFAFQLDLVRCLWAIFPATVLWGAAFPFSLAAAARPGLDPARLVGRLYAANTAGAIAGAVGCAMLLIPTIGTQRTHQFLIALAAGAALLVIAPTRRLLLPAAAVFAALLAWTVPPVPWQLVAFGRQLPTTIGSRDLVFAAEGMNASIAVTRIVDARFFHVGGKVEASTQGEDMRLQGMLGHLPALVHRDPRSVLVVGFGAGVTAGSFLPHPSLQRLVICEIEPVIPRLVGPVFRRENNNVLNDRRTQLVLDDGRHYVLTTPETFDIITSDPIHPWVKGNAALYTREYFEHCKRRLRPGGIVTQWVPLYESDFDTVRSEIATFFEVFPNGTIWGNDFDGEGYDMVLMSEAADALSDVDAVERRAAHPEVAASLRRAGFRSASSLLGTYAGSAPDLRAWLAGAEINRDRNLRLHYLAGMSVNSRLASAIYYEILRRRR